MGTEEHSYQRLSGYVVGFGSTVEEAEHTLRAIRKDQWFSGNSLSMVFEWVLYNANSDMFTYNSAEFSLLPTGVVRKRTSTQAFALTMFSLPTPAEFGKEDANSLHFGRLITGALMCIYAAFASWFLFNFAADMKRQFAISGEQQRPIYGFLIDFFKEDPWNYTDVFSVLMNVGVIMYFLLYIYYPLSFSGD